MNKITTIHLNGQSFQIEETGFDVLSTYLDKSKTALADNPDKDEIILDLEQAIADKCRIYLSAHKNTILTSEIQKIVDEMGPVKNATDEQNSSTDNSGNSSTHSNSSTRGPHIKRLYQIHEGAMISGVCNGLAAYFDIDVTLVRILFIIFTFLTGGGFILVYVVMMFVIPSANTPEDFAKAYNMPLNAQELVNRAKEHYARFKDKHFKQEWRDRKQAWKHEYRQQRMRWKYEYNSPNSWASVVRPLVDTIVGLVWLGVLLFLIAVVASHPVEMNYVLTQVHTGLSIFIEWVRSLFQ